MCVCVCAWVVQSVYVCVWVVQRSVCVCMGCTKCECVCMGYTKCVCVCVHGLYKGLLSCVVVQRVALICVWGVEEGSGVQKWVVGCRSG